MTTRRLSLLAGTVLVAWLTCTGPVWGQPPTGLTESRRVAESHRAILDR